LRKELPIVAENGTGSFYGKINRKKRKIFFKKRSNKCPRIWTVDRDIEVQNCRQKPKYSEDIKKRKPTISRIRCSKKTSRNFTETWARRL